MAKQTESYELHKLRPQVDDLFKEFDALVDRPLDEREDLAAIFKVLEEIRDKIKIKHGGKKVDDDELLPRSKRGDLANLLPLIRTALELRSKPPPPPPVQQDATGGAHDSKPTGCIPCKPRASQQHKEEKEGSKEVVSLKLLLRLTQNVLEPEQYYEWTTSYVDEERIYGWDKEAGEVIDALVAAADGSGARMFRAAGIAGIHGSGKTALARKVFVHDKAKDNFALRLWVCVGPPDSEDRFNLLYRMLDNLGLDTDKVEEVVDKSSVVRDARGRTEAELRKAAARPAEQKKAEGSVVVTEAGAGGDANRQAKDEELLKEKVENSRAVEKSKIGKCSRSTIHGNAMAT
jgi:hypothetical protein